MRSGSLGPNPQMHKNSSNTKNPMLETVDTNTTKYSAGGFSKPPEDIQ